MKVILINGSPRKNWNTHKLLMEAERGAKEAGAETELIHLFDLNYKDCRSCFACKLKGNTTEGICAIRDDLKPVYEKIMDAEGLIIGKIGYTRTFEGMSQTIGRLLGSCETLYSCDTCQFTDYSKYYAGMFDERHKAEHRDRQFPIDLAQAFELGKKIAEMGRTRS